MMTNLNEKYEKKLIDELRLHDSEVIGLKIQNNVMTIEISCKGMGLSYYFDGIDDVTVIINASNIKKVFFDFLNSIILINDFSIEKHENYYSISINCGEDLYIEASNYDINFVELKEYNKYYKKLDEFLKSDK